MRLPAEQHICSTIRFKCLDANSYRSAHFPLHSFIACPTFCSLAFIHSHLCCALHSRATPCAASFQGIGVKQHMRQVQKLPNTIYCGGRGGSTRSSGTCTKAGPSSCSSSISPCASALRAGCCCCAGGCCACCACCGPLCACCACCADAHSAGGCQCAKAEGDGSTA